MLLSTRSLRELIDLFDQSGQSILGTEGQRLQGVPGWELARRVVLSDQELTQWTECVGYAGSYPATRDGERVPVEVEEDTEPDRYEYRCPETFHCQYVFASILAVHAVAEAKLLNYLADQLGISQVYRQGIIDPAIPGVLWNLGKMRIADVLIDVWLVRGLYTSISVRWWRLLDV